MNLSRTAKAALAVAALVALILFLIVVDLGVNAGRVHYGVSVTGVDLGGMTRVEASRELVDRRKDIRKLVILLTAEGLNVGVQPRCLGWRPDVRSTVRAAYDVGREDAPFGALADRVSSWLWGTKIDFRGTFRSDFLDYQIERWDERLRGLGRPIDRDALRALLDEAVARADTGPFEFPIHGEASSASPTRSRWASRPRVEAPSSRIPRGKAPPSRTPRARRAPLSPLQAPRGLPPACRLQNVTPGE